MKNAFGELPFPVEMSEVDIPPPVFTADQVATEFVAEANELADRLDAFYETWNPLAGQFEFTEQQQQQIQQATERLNRALDLCQ